MYMYIQPYRNYTSTSPLESISSWPQLVLQTSTCTQIKIEPPPPVVLAILWVSYLNFLIHACLQKSDINQMLNYRFWSRLCTSADLMVYILKLVMKPRSYYTSHSNTCNHVPCRVMCTCMYAMKLCHNIHTWYRLRFQETSLWGF